MAKVLASLLTNEGLRKLHSESEKLLGLARATDRLLVKMVHGRRVGFGSRSGAAG